MDFDDKYIEEIRVILGKSNNTYLTKLVERLISERKELKEIVKKVAPEKVQAAKKTIVSTPQPSSSNGVKYSTVLVCDIDNYASFIEKNGEKLGTKILNMLHDKLKNVAGTGDMAFKYDINKVCVVFAIANLEDVKKRVTFFKTEVDKLKGIYNVPFDIRCGISTYEEGKSLKDASKEAKDALTKLVDDNENNDVYVYKKTAK